jgi:hypothetical protein
VVFLKPAVLVLFDEVSLEQPLPVQARFQVFNDDKLGRLQCEERRFRIDRPAASLLARVATSNAATVNARRLEIPDAGDQFPFAEIASAPATEHRLLTVCTAAPAGADHGEITLTADGETWQVRGPHLGREISLQIGSAANGYTLVIL